MANEEKMYLNLVLDGEWITLFEQGKDKSGIKSNSEFIRYLITKYARQENE